MWLTEKRISSVYKCYICKHSLSKLVWFTSDMILEILCTDILNYQIRYLKFTNTIIFSPEVAEWMDMGSPIFFKKWVKMKEWQFFNNRMFGGFSRTLVVYSFFRIVLTFSWFHIFYFLFSRLVYVTIYRHRRFLTIQSICVLE